MSPAVHALVPAAGSGERFGSAEPKVFVGLAGRPALLWTLERLLEGGVDHLVVALSSEWIESGSQRISRMRPDLASRARVVEGGADRQESVERCLAASSAGPTDLILVHDGARAAIHPRDVERVVEAARVDGAAVLGRPVTDTLKRCRGGWIEETIDRSQLFRAETPQVAQRSLLDRALEKARDSGFRETDESSLLEACGIEVRAVCAQHPNPKLTYAADLVQLEVLLAGSDPAQFSEPPMRTES